MLADLIAYRTGEGLVLDCEPALVGRLLELLAKYAVFHRIAVGDETQDRAVLHVEGPTSPAVLERAGFDTPLGGAHSHIAAACCGVPTFVARESRAGGEGFDLRAGNESIPAVLARLKEAGALPIGEETLEAGRIEAGIPRWGAELDESVLPSEAGLERTAISYNKGCYIGQETVARIKTYGHVNRLLVGLRLPYDAAVETGADVLAPLEGLPKVGRITSAMRSESAEAILALAYVKREFAGVGTRLEVASPRRVADAVSLEEASGRPSVTAEVVTLPVSGPSAP